MVGFFVKNTLLTKKEIIKKFELVLSPTGNSWSKLLNISFKNRCNKCYKNCRILSSSTFIYLISKKQNCDWRRFSFSTTWNYIAGSPVRITEASTEKQIGTEVVGPDYTIGHVPISNLNPDVWLKTEPLGNWSFFSCTYSPGFEFGGMEIAVSSWEPGLGEPELSFPGEIWTP